MNDTGIGRLPLIYNKIDKLLKLKRLFFNAIKIKYLSLSQGKKCDIPLCSDQECYTESQKRVSQRQYGEWFGDLLYVDRKGLRVWK